MPAGSSFWRENDAKQQALMVAYLLWSTHVGASIGCDHTIDLVSGDWDPLAVHFDFVVAVYPATPGWTTIRIVAARPPTIISFELCVKVSMPYGVADRVVSVLCQRKGTQRY